MDQEFLKDTREYIWNYFIAHAEARLATFRFYLAFCTILVAGLIAILGTNKTWLASPFALLISFLSFIYWKVDVRHKDLIKHAEEALEYLEMKLPIPEIEPQSQVLQLFHSEAVRSKSYQRFPKHFRLNAYFSYSTCVNIVFLVFGLVGIVLAIAPII